MLLVVAPALEEGPIVATGIATSGLRRTPNLPDLPTVDQSGLKGFDGSSWNGVVMPAGTPREIVMTLNETIRKAVATPDVKDRYAEIGADVFVSSPEEFGAFVKSEIERWHDIVKKYGIVLEP